MISVVPVVAVVSAVTVLPMVTIVTSFIATVIVRTVTLTRLQFNVAVAQDAAYNIIVGNANGTTTKFLAVQVFDCTVRIFSREILEDSGTISRSIRSITIFSNTYPCPGKSRSISAKETLPASLPKSFKSYVE